MGDIFSSISPPTKDVETTTTTTEPLLDPEQYKHDLNAGQRMIFDKLLKLSSYESSSSGISEASCSPSKYESMRQRATNLGDASYICQFIQDNRREPSSSSTSSSNRDVIDAATDSSLSAKQMRVRLLISSSTTNVGFLGVFTDFGIVHTGLVLGSTLVDWNESALCIPRDIRSRTALMLINAGTLDLDEPETTSRLMDMSKRIVSWNMKSKYSKVSNNCQHFVKDILDVLGLASKLPGQLGEFMESLRKGSFELRFRDPLMHQEHLFTTHEELDIYVDDLLNRVCNAQGKDPDTTERVVLFKMLYKDDAELLLAFDRAFWASFVTDPNEKNSPRMVGTFSKTSCPFELSLETKNLFKVPDALLE